MPPTAAAHTSWSAKESGLKHHHICWNDWPLTTMPLSSIDSLWL